MAEDTAQHGTARADGTVVSRFDPNTPHPARIYNYWLAGKDHFPADRRAAEEVIRHRPEVVAGAQANRAFLARSVRYLAARRGIRQFLDIGAGPPAPANTHEVAQQAAPDCAVVYADNDPLVLVYARALLTARPAGAATSMPTCATPPPCWKRRPGPWTSPARPPSSCSPSCTSSRTATTRGHRRHAD